MSTPSGAQAAQDLLVQADKKLKSWSLFNPSGKYEEAVEMILQAGAKFKIAKMWQEAGDCYKRAAVIFRDNLKNRPDTLINFVEAAKAYKQCNGGEAATLYEQCAKLYMEDNKFAQAAKLWDEVGQLKVAAGKKSEAIIAYQTSGDCYKTENSKVTSQSMYIKAADLMAEEGEYKQAIKIYEEVSEAQSENASMAFSVKNHLFKSLICQFVIDATTQGDCTDTETLVQRYTDNNPRFAGTKEEQLINDLCKAFKDHDVQKYTSLLAKHDQIYRLDNLTASLFYKIKVAMTTANESDKVADAIA